MWENYFIKVCWIWHAFKVEYDLRWTKSENLALAFGFYERKTNKGEFVTKFVGVILATNFMWKQPEAAVKRCSVKKAVWKISQNSQGNTCARISIFNKITGWLRYFQNNAQIEQYKNMRKKYKNKEQNLLKDDHDVVFFGCCFVVAVNH